MFPSYIQSIHLPSVTTRLLHVTAATLITLTAGTANATLIELGTATGGWMNVYNNTDIDGAGGVPDGIVSGFDEGADNQAYLQAQNTYDNTNGMSFQFSNSPLPVIGSWNAVFSGQPVGQSQFGLDIYAPAPTYDPSGGVTLPQIFFADYNGGGAGDFSSTLASNGTGVAWAINDYKFNSPSGPGNTSNVPHNSIFRGTGFSIDMANSGLTITEDTDADGIDRNRFFDLRVKGTLITDGLIHWYSPAIGTSSLADWGLSDTIEFEGNFRYDAFYGAPDAIPGTVPADTTGLLNNGLYLENGADQRDFYSGSLTLSVRTLEEVPAPATLALFGLGLLGLRLGRQRQS